MTQPRCDRGSQPYALEQTEIPPMMTMMLVVVVAVQKPLQLKELQSSMMVQAWLPIHHLRGLLCSTLSSRIGLDPS